MGKTDNKQISQYSSYICICLHINFHIVHKYTSGEVSAIKIIGQKMMVTGLFLTGGPEGTLSGGDMWRTWKTLWKMFLAVRTRRCKGSWGRIRLAGISKVTVNEGDLVKDQNTGNQAWPSRAVGRSMDHPWRAMKDHLGVEDENYKFWNYKFWKRKKIPLWLEKIAERKKSRKKN